MYIQWNPHKCGHPEINQDTLFNRTMHYFTPEIRTPLQSGHIWGLHIVKVQYQGVFTEEGSRNNSTKM